MALTKISSGVIAANAVVDSFGTQSITGDKIGLTAINANNIVNASITGAKLAANTVTGDKITVNQITGNLLTANCVSGNNIVASPTIAGNVTVNGSIGIGGATPASSGYGITFPATQVLSSDANTLDDYEEGTFTPIFKGSGSNPTPTYHTQSGKYTKIGRLVEVEIYLRFTAYSGGTGAPQIGGLPFTSSSSVNAFLVWGESTGFTLGGTYYNIVAEVDTNATTATLLKGAPNAATTSMAFSEVGTATTVYMLVSGCYTTT